MTEWERNLEWEVVEQEWSRIGAGSGGYSTKWFEWMWLFPSHTPFICSGLNVCTNLINQQKVSHSLSMITRLDRPQYIPSCNLSQHLPFITKTKTTATYEWWLSSDSYQINTTTVNMIQTSQTS